jgi:nuclear pore complex protein Nup53
LNSWLGARGAKAIDARGAPSTTNAAFTTAAVLSDSEAEHWVTVYGFSKDEKAVVLREFQRDGDIVNFGAFNDSGISVNWLHVRFATKESARRALRRNGQNISGIMVGVKELDAKSRADVGAGGSGEGRLSRNASVRRVAPMRDGISLQPRQRTTWDKVVQFIFGA